MPSQPVKHERETRKTHWLAAALVVAASTFAAVALFAPRAVRPNRLPALVLDHEAAAQAIAKDHERAKHPPSGRWVGELRELHARVGRGAHETAHAASTIRTIYRMAERRTRTVRQNHGDEGLWSMRAAAVVQLEAALAHEMPERKRHELLGKFEEQLVRYKVRSQDGAMRAPEVVMWAMFKARWNRIGGLEPTEGFEPIEVQAFEGWLALHAVGAPADKRFEAARRFHKVGGHNGAEAVAVWAILSRAGGLAQRTLAEALRTERNVRLRNYAIALAERR